MSQLHPIAGSYLDSSDHEGDVNTTPMQPVPFAPPRVTTALNSGLGKFQLPGSTKSSRASVPPVGKVANRHSSVSRHPTPLSNVQSRQGTPALSIGGSGADSNSVATLNSTAKRANESLAPRVHGAQPNLRLERQLNELSGSLEEHKSTSERQLNVIEDTLARILATIERLEASTSHTTPSVHLAPSTLDKSSDCLPNPPATAELTDIVIKVVAEARSRVGTKKAGPDENHAKEHARNNFYRMLGISCAREVKPYFLDKYGEPDTLPDQFKNPINGYIQPCPNWELSLAKQVIWVPTYVRQFRMSIPKNQTPQAEMLRNLSDEQIIVLLHDGPFRSASTAWRNMKKSDQEVKDMQSNARQYQRCERKAITRGMHIQSIPALQDPKWSFLSHPGFMSPDESEDEGVLLTKLPDYRAQWVNNLYAAIEVAEQAKRRPRPGASLRRIKIIERSIPHLERGTGCTKATVCIAQSAISKSWREAHLDEFSKSTHFIGMQATAKPDIASFLAQYPESGTAVTESPAIKEEKTGLHGSYDARNGDNGSDSWDGVNYIGDEESGAILETNPYWASGSAAEPRNSGQETENRDSIQIDPEVLADEASHQMIYKADRTHPVLPKHSDAPPGFHSSDMPPPPPLPSVSDSSKNQATEILNPAVFAGTKGKKRAAPGRLVESVDTLEEGNTGASLAPKRRGRPPGSKNKKTKVASEAP
ncbi:hypothetical protein RhiJN_24287 [Ceratobasidium sp. AG-Ba]|nr:hypothetical protein RhiJN_24287 [Ceratobasidium sp. AG-Ba]